MSRLRLGGTRRLVLATIAALVVLGAVATPVAGAQTAADDAGDSKLIVALEADGDATVTLRTSFVLDREAERRALERLRENRSALAADFEAGMRGLAERTAEATGREMRVTSAAATVSTDGQTGVVELSVVWTGLAAVEGDRLVVSQPFSAGFTPPGRFEVRGPDGYALAESTPSATTTDDGAATWEAGAPLDGFEATFAPADATSTALPGFGAPAALGALATVAGTAALLARRRR